MYTIPFIFIFVNELLGVNSFVGIFNFYSAQGRVLQLFLSFIFFNFFLFAFIAFIVINFFNLVKVVINSFDFQTLDVFSSAAKHFLI